MKKLKLGTEKTVLEVISVSATASSKTQNGTFDSRVFKVLQDAGFVGLKYATKRLRASSPEGDTLFLLEYDASNPANQKPFKLVRFNQSLVVCEEIDIGYTTYVSGANSAGFIEVFSRSNKLIDWELKCKTADEKTVRAYRIMVACSNILKYNEPIEESHL